MTPIMPEPLRPPHNLDAEQALLGALLYNNALVDEVADIVAADAFFDPVHGRIWAGILELVTSGRRADPITLRHAFDADSSQSFAAAMGKSIAGYLGTLVANVVSLKNCRAYAQIIVDLAKRRRLVLLAEDLRAAAADATSFEDPADRLIEDAERQLFEISSAAVSAELAPAGSHAPAVIAAADRAFREKRQITGLTTGLADLDRSLGGFHASDLVILAGRPGSGKTALAASIALATAEAALRDGSADGAPVALFSLEMSNDQLTRRLLSGLARIDQRRIQKGDLTPEDFRALTAAAERLGKLPLFLTDAPALTPQALRSRTRRLKRRHPSLGLVVVDYLQLMQADGRAARENRVYEISEISRALKLMAKELDVTVLALSQLSRNVESRDDKVPQLSDLRDSGAIEQDADVVLFVYREAYYHARAEPKQREGEADARFAERHAQWQQKGRDIASLAEIVVAKHRHGATGRVMLHFDEALVSFSNLAANRT